MYMNNLNQKRLVFFMTLIKSSSEISPSPSLSASSIISYNSSSVIVSPNSLATRLRFLKEILPELSSSNSLKALRISSLGSLSAILTVITSKKSQNSITPLPSLSMSAIILFTSSFLGSNPNARIATFNSLASICPRPSVSNKSNASFISCFYSSVSSYLPLRTTFPIALFDLKLAILRFKFKYIIYLYINSI